MGYTDFTKELKSKKVELNWEDSFQTVRTEDNTINEDNNVTSYDETIKLDESTGIFYVQ